jgi:hypothetical protein
MMRGVIGTRLDARAVGVLREALIEYLALLSREERLLGYDPKEAHLERWHANELLRLTKHGSVLVYNDLEQLAAEGG